MRKIKILSLKELQDIIWNVDYEFLTLDKYVKITFNGHVYTVEPFLSNGYLGLRVYLHIKEECLGIFALYTYENYFEFVLQSKNKRFKRIYEDFLSMLEQGLKNLYEGVS